MRRIDEKISLPRETDIHLVFMHKQASTQEVLSRFHELDLQAADLRETLSLLLAFPKLPFDFTIAALGTTVDGYTGRPNEACPSFYPAPNGLPHGTVIWIAGHFLKDPWRDGTCFLGVPMQDNRITHHT